MPVCENGIDCLPMFRWGWVSDQVRQENTGFLDNLGNLMFFVGAMIWQIVGVLLRFLEFSLVETSLLADRVTAWLFTSLPLAVQVAIGFGFVISIVLGAGSKLGGVRKTAVTLVLSASLLGVFTFLVRAAVAEVNSGDTTPAQEFASPSWIVNEISTIIDPVLSEATDIASDFPRTGESGGVLNCHRYRDKLVETAEKDIPYATLAASSTIWEQTYFSYWTDVSFRDAETELACLVSEWEAGVNAWEIASIACYSLADLSDGECDWTKAGLPEPTIKNLTNWSGPIHISQTTNLVIPWYLCAYDNESNRWRINREANDWHSYFTLEGTQSYSPAALQEACGRWWNSEIVEGLDCQTEVDNILCTLNPQPDNVQDENIDDESAELLADIERIRPELLDDSRIPPWAISPTAASSHELWATQIAPGQALDDTTLALIGQPEGVLLAGFLAVINAITFGGLILFGTSIALLGGVMLVFAIMFLPAAAIAYTIQGSARAMAGNIIALAKRGLLYLVVGHGMMLTLLLVVFVIARFFETDDTGDEARIFLLVFNLIVWVFIFIFIRRQGTIQEVKSKLLSIPQRSRLPSVENNSTVDNIDAWTLEDVRRESPELWEEIRQNPELLRELRQNSELLKLISDNPELVGEIKADPEIIRDIRRNPDIVKEREYNIRAQTKRKSPTQIRRENIQKVRQQRQRTRNAPPPPPTKNSE